MKQQAKRSTVPLLRIQFEKFEFCAAGTECLPSCLEYEIDIRFLDQTEIHRVNESSLLPCSPPIACEMRCGMRWMTRAREEESIGTTGESTCHPHTDTEENVLM